MTALDGVNGTPLDFVFDTRGEHRFSREHLFAAETSVLSCICVIIILFCIGRNVRWYKKMFPNGDWKLFRGPADIYMFSLFAFDLLQSFGGILDIRWAHNGIVTTGPYCTAQGIIQQFSETGVALITLLLAVHTFVAAVLQVGLRARGVALSLVCLACISDTLWVAIGAGSHKNYVTPTPDWCWISPQYPGERLGGEYIWLWIALGVSAILYIPLYFWVEGYWSVDEGYNLHWWNADHRVGYAQRRAALGMLLYPLAYSVIVLPTSIARWLQFSHPRVPSAAILFGTTMFHLSGAVNVFLFLNFRPGLLLFPRPRLDEQEMQGTTQEDTGTAIVSVTMNFQHGPGPTSAALGNDGSKDSATTSQVSPRQISGDIDAGKMNGDLKQ